jgi:PTH1 family peptidyl-tRNA hydrolase
MYYILGLGNPGEEYAGTRHNIGRDVVAALAARLNFDQFAFDKKYSGQLSSGEAYGEKIFLVLPDTFMNKSGVSLKYIVMSEKKAEKLIVVRDDLDLPLGTLRIHFNRSSGGHRGVESVMKTIRTEAFIQIKIGVAPVTPGGKTKKPDAAKVIDFIIAPFKKSEDVEVKKVKKEAVEALIMIIADGKQKAMGQFNS